MIGPHIDHSLPGPGSPKKRKRGPGPQRHWDDPEQQSSMLPYDEDVEIKEDPDNDNVEEGEEEEESRELTHDEIWDDSALIAAWESATAEYEVTMFISFVLYFTDWCIRLITVRAKSGKKNPRRSRHCQYWVTSPNAN